MQRPTWGRSAQQVTALLSDWLAHVHASLAQAALDRGDVRVLARLLAEKQKTAPDLVVQATTNQGRRIIILYVEGLVDTERLTTILSSLNDTEVTVMLSQTGVSQQRTGQWERVVQGCLSGDVVVFRAGVPGAVLATLQKPPHRSISRPKTELAIRGPQEAFVETSTIQLAQLRQRLPDPALAIEAISVGTRAPMACNLVYIDGLASATVVDTVRQRLKAITIDTTVNATRIGSLIRDHHWALFPTVRYTERVDLAALHLQNGKVVVLVAGDPFAITVPAALVDFYQTTADYTLPWYDASFVRLLRLLAWGFGVFLPGLYIALTEVNPDLLPPALFDIVAGSHTGLPFTPILEVVVMILVIEILREAALRLPSVLASTLGTVGAIVVGTAVVKAGFVSPQIIVVMTFTALSLFSGPSYELLATWRLMNWAMLGSAYILGLYGILLTTLWLSIELVTLTSFGTPYLAPGSPLRPKDWRNYLVRLPWRHVIRRSTTGRGQDLRWMERP